MQIPQTNMIYNYIALIIKIMDMPAPEDLNHVSDLDHKMEIYPICPMCDFFPFKG